MQSYVFEPPVFVLENKLEWREEMESWIELVAQRATVDKTFKGICSSLALLVMGSLPKSQQQVITGAMSRGEIVKKHPSFQMQLRAVQQMVALVAEDTPIEKVARVAQAFRNVSQCKRSKGESLKKFGIRFQGLAQQYLRVSGAKQNDAAGMVLALNFLENANLQPETRNQVQLQLHQGKELEDLPLSSRHFLCDDYKSVDWYARVHVGVETDENSTEGIGVLVPETLQMRHRLAERKRLDSIYSVPENLFSSPDTPVPVFTIDDIFLVFNRMPDLSESHDDHVTSKQLRSFMASVKKDSGGASQGQGSGGRGQGQGKGQKRSRNDNGDVECGRCFSLTHLWDDCPMKTSKCDSCGKVGHESWICFSAANVDVRDRESRLKWGRERATSKGLRQSKPSSPRAQDSPESRGRQEQGSTKPSTLFARRRRG